MSIQKRYSENLKFVYIAKESIRSHFGNSVSATSYNQTDTKY